MSIVKELCHAVCAAGRPGRSLVEADEQRGHQVVSTQVPEQPLAGFGVVVRHAQHVACGGEKKKKERGRQR